MHTNNDPIPRPTRSEISTVVEDALRANKNARALDVPRCLRQRFGLNSSNASARKDFNKLRTTGVGYGNFVEDVLRE